MNIAGPGQGVPPQYRQFLGGGYPGIQPPRPPMPQYPGIPHPQLPGGAQNGHMPYTPNVPRPQAPGQFLGQGLPQGGQNPLVHQLVQYLMQGGKARHQRGPVQTPPIGPIGPFRY